MDGPSGRGRVWLHLPVGSTVAIALVVAASLAMGSVMLFAKGQPAPAAQGTPAASPGESGTATPGSLGGALPPAPSPAPAGTVVITEGSASPVTVSRGAMVQVDLGPSVAPWNEPQSRDPGILARVSASQGSDGSAHALFRAVGDGTTTVFAAQAPPPCYPKCLMPQRAWDITVIVQG